jgi:hypothetical protein
MVVGVKTDASLISKYLKKKSGPILFRTRMRSGNAIAKGTME